MKHMFWMGEVLKKTFPDILCYYRETFSWDANRSGFPRVMTEGAALEIFFHVPVPPEQISFLVCRKPASPALQEAVGV